MFFQIYAIAIMLLFYGCYFIKMYVQRTKNIQTVLLGKGKTGYVRGIEIALKTMSFVLPIAEVVSVFLNKTVLPLWARIFGAVVGTAGVTVFIVSVYEMKDNWRAGVPESKETELVTSGIYKYSRNPAFLGFDMIYIGILCMFYSVPLLVLTALTIFVFHLQIVIVEEPFMTEAFGQDYSDYKKTVCRYMGRKR